MKKVLKFIMYLIITLAVAAGAYFAYIKYFASAGNVDAFNTIPEDAVFIVETTNLSDAWSTINSSDLWQYLIKTEYFADLNKDIETVNSFLDSNTVADKLLKNRKLIIAAVMSTSKQWDFLFAVDLEKGSSSIKSLKSLTNFISGFNSTKIDFESNDKDYEIIKLVDKNNSDFKVFITFADNILLVSFNGSIIEKSLEQLDDNHWKKDKKFTQIIEKIPLRKQFKIYLNYNNLDNFTNTFLTGEDETINMLSKSLAYSILNLEIKDEFLSLEGFANLDSIGSYVHALADVDPGKKSAYKIMTNQSAAYISIGFEDYYYFYENLMNEYTKNYPDEAEDIEKGLNIVKNVIKIDIEKDLFSWIGNEVALFKIRPLSDLSKKDDIALVIHSNDIDNAKNGMDNIVTQIRKWSPFRFKEYEYRGYKINFLKQKNFFKLFLGKIFENIEEPYFTYIEDYVVFSNSKEVLHQIVDDYISGSILSKDEKFQSFIDEFKVKSNIATFINMPKMYPTLYYFTPIEDRNDLKENEELIKSIARIGFQLVSEGDFFNTTILAQYDPKAYYEDLTQLIEAQTNLDMFTNYIDTLGFLIEFDDKIEDGKYVQYYTYKEIQARIEGEVIDNKPDGLWRTYYETGNIKSAVTYDYGKADGIAYFYYDDVENTLRAEVSFKENKIVDDYKEYYDNGARKATIVYEDGEKDGNAEYYYRTGDIKIEGKFKNGQKHGRWKFYDENGNKINTERWRKGDKKSD